MTTDISIIKKELENFQEVKNPFKIKPNTIVKYITIQNDGEKFYTGGKMCYCKSNKLVLKNDLSGKEWHVPVTVDKYKSHFYIPINNEDHNNNDYDENYIKLNKIIETQQRVIDKISIKNAKLESGYEEYKNRSINYEELLQNNRYELERYKMTEKQLLLEIKRLKGIET
jgi:hypothetical protein